MSLIYHVGPQKISIGCPKPWEKPVVPGMFQSDGKLTVIFSTARIPLSEFYASYSYLNSEETKNRKGAYTNRILLDPEFRRRWTSYMAVKFHFLLCSHAEILDDSFLFRTRVL